MHPKYFLRFLGVLIALTLVAAACGNDDDTSTEQGAAATTDTGDNTAPDTEEADAEEPVAQDEPPPESEEPPADSEEMEVTSIRYLTFSAAPDNLANLDAMIAGFETENPDVAIEVETLPFDEYFSVLRTQIAGNDAPDAFELNFESFVSFAAAGTLADLGPLAGGGVNAEPYYQRAYEAFSLDGSQYGLPESYSTVVLFYNKELFDLAGLDYPTDDWTWEDEKAAAATLAALDDTTFGFFAGIQFWEFYKTAAQNGCDFFDGDQVTIDQPNCVEALQFMLDYVDDSSQPTSAEMAGISDGDMFLNGELGMITTGIWMFDAFSAADFDWDIVVEPGNTEGGSHFFANGVSVSASSDKQDAAFRWIEYFTSSPDAARIRVDASWELPTLTDQSLYDSYLAQDPPANRAAVLASLENVVIPPAIERQGEMQDAVNAALELAVAGELTAAEALARANEEVQALIP